MGIIPLIWWISLRGSENSRNHKRVHNVSQSAQITQITTIALSLCGCSGSDSDASDVRWVGIGKAHAEVYRETVAEMERVVSLVRMRRSQPASDVDAFTRELTVLLDHQCARMKKAFGTLETPLDAGLDTLDVPVLVFYAIKINCHIAVLSNNQRLVFRNRSWMFETP